MIKKMLGSILMIIGTSVGAGMLALPIATAHEHFYITLLLMIFSWIIMTIGAFAILEVNLWFKPGANLISMVDKTLGVYAKQITWIIYLLLFYSLLCAYLSGSSDILQGLLRSAHINLPKSFSTVLALLLLSFMVIRGVGTVDVMNRFFMGTKLLVYIILIIAIMPYISLTALTQGNYILKSDSLMLMMTSFGFASIVPTLRVYLENHVSNLKKVILLASVLALMIYLCWTISVQGLLPRQGNHGLLAMLASKEPNSLLMQSLYLVLHNPFLGVFAKIFISICAVTSFLGVALCMTDFIADGFQYQKKGMEKIKIYGFTFLPPLCIVLLMPNVFIKALSYAGFFCVFLLILLPVVMLYCGRYKKIFIKNNHQIIVPGGKLCLITVFCIAVALLLMQLLAMKS